MLALTMGLSHAVADAAPRLKCLVVDVTSGVGGFHTLQAAVDSASSGDTLVVKGTCFGSTATELKRLTIIGKASPGTSAYGLPTLDGLGLGPVLTIGIEPFSGGPITITNLTIRNGTFGIFDRGDLTVVDSVVTANAGIGIVVDEGSVAMTGSSVNNNGGSGISGFEAFLSVSYSTISGNTTSGSGGAVSARSGWLTLDHVVVRGNTAEQDAGGMVLHDNSSTVSDSVVSGNVAGGDGGGILNRYGQMTVTRSTIEGNTTGLGGGGIFEWACCSSAVVTDSTITGNTALDGQHLGSNVGGGIANCEGTLTLQGASTVTGNHPDDFGTGYCP
jgi:hypothetical protein